MQVLSAPVMGIILALVMATLSGAAGVYTELIMKKRPQRNVNVQVCPRPWPQYADGATHRCFVKFSQPYQLDERDGQRKGAVIYFAVEYRGRKLTSCPYSLLRLLPPAVCVGDEA